MNRVIQQKWVTSLIASVVTIASYIILRAATIDSDVVIFVSILLGVLAAQFIPQLVDLDDEPSVRRDRKRKTVESTSEDE